MDAGHRPGVGSHGEWVRSAVVRAQHSRTRRDTLIGGTASSSCATPPNAVMSPPSTRLLMPESTRTQATRQCRTALRRLAGAHKRHRGTSRRWRRRACSQLLRGQPPPDCCQGRPSRSSRGPWLFEHLTSACLSRCRLPPAHAWPLFVTHAEDWRRWPPRCLMHYSMRTDHGQCAPEPPYRRSEPSRGPGPSGSEPVQG